MRRAIEAGSLTVEIGLLLEAAVIVGVTLFTYDPSELVASPKDQVLDDDF